MIAFDYLHAEYPAWLRSVQTLRVPADCRAPLAAIVLCFAFVCAACSLEHLRLAQARSLTERYRRQMEASAAALSRAHVRARRMRAVILLDEELRRIRQSGDLEASRLAEIAQLLPAHVWLTAIRREGGFIVLEGRARSFASLGSAIARLSTARDLHAADLAGAQVAADPRGAGRVTYTVRASAAP